MRKGFTDPRGQAFPPNNAPWPGQFSDHDAPTESFMPSSMGLDTSARRTVRPEQLIRRPSSAPIGNPLQKMKYLWLRDPAYRVLFIAIGTIIISGLFASIALASWFSGSTHPTTQAPAGNANSNGNKQIAQVASTPTMVPTPVPTTVVQLIIPTPIPTIAPDPIILPTQAMQQNGPLSVQATNLPDAVNNNTNVSVEIQASQPGVKVSLLVTYNVLPGIYNSRSQMVDNNGNTKLTWKVATQKLPKGGTATARVTVVVQDNMGQIVTSQAIEVQVNANR